MRDEHMGAHGIAAPRAGCSVSRLLHEHYIEATVSMLQHEFRVGTNLKWHDSDHHAISRSQNICFLTKIDQVATPTSNFML